MDEQLEKSSRPPLPPPSCPSAKVCEQQLPPDWNYARDPSGNVYYYNYKTNQTQWNPPVVNSAANLVEIPIMLTFAPLQHEQAASCSTGNLSLCQKVTGSQELAVRETRPIDRKATPRQHRTSIGVIQTNSNNMENEPTPLGVSRSESKPIARFHVYESASKPATVIQTTPEKLHFSQPVTSEAFPSSAEKPKQLNHHYRETFGSFAKWNCDLDTLISVQAANRPTQFQCLRCNQSFPHQQSLDKHSCISGDNSLYTCEGCNLSFSSEEKLQQHILYCGPYEPNDPASKDIYLCESCRKSFSVEEQYRAHVLYCGLHKPDTCVVSAATNLHTCEHCNRSFSGEEEFQRHVLYCGLYHQNNSEAPAAENKCLDNNITNSKTAMLTEEELMDVLLPQYKIGHENNMQLIPHRDGFKCPYCAKVIAYKAGMIIHIRTHTGERPYACSLCNKKYAERGKLNRHVRRIHKGETPNTSSRKRFDNMSAGKDNEMIHTPEETIFSATNFNICEKCNKPFSAEKEFQQHVLKCGREPNDGQISQAASEGKDVAAKQEIVVLTAEQFKDAFPPQNEKCHQYDTKLIPHKDGFKCPYCEKVITHKKDMIFHIRRHAGERPYACSLCNKKYAEKAKLNRHMRRIHKDQLQNPSSRKRFIVVSAFKDNEMIYAEENGDEKVSVVEESLADQPQSDAGHPFKCKQCEKVFESKQSLYGHVEIHNIKEKLYQCAYCMICFPTKHKLELHLRIHTGEEPFQCSYCEKVFRTSQLRNSHERSHSDKKAFQCSHCEKTFKVKKNLMNHVRVHIGEKRFLCSTCGKCFLTKRELEFHTRVHTGERPYICSYCEKGFSTSSGRIGHVRSVHTGEKPYECTECQRRFTFCSAFKRHLRTHSGEKPYACSHCGKTFAQSSARKAHEFTHTGERPFVCACGRAFIQKGLLNFHKRKCILGESKTKALDKGTAAIIHSD